VGLVCFGLPACCSIVWRVLLLVTGTQRVSIMSHCCTGVAHAAVPCPKRLFICPLLAICPPGVPWRFARLRHVNSAASFPYMRRVLTPTGVYAVDVRRTLAYAMCVVLKLYACYAVHVHTGQWACPPLWLWVVSPSRYIMSTMRL